MKFTSLITGAALLAMSAGFAVASPVTLSKQNKWDVFDGGGSQSVKIRNKSYPFESARVDAGGFRLSDGVNDLIAWCLDITHNLSLPSPYKTTDDPFSNSYGLTDVQKANVENLFETSYSTLDLSNDAQSAGFQLALWEVIYEKSGTFDVTDGNFYARASSAASDLANAFLGNLGGAITQAYNFTYYESLGYKSGWGKKKWKKKYSQNLVSVTPVPLPAAGLLLTCGLAGLYVVNRRKKA